MVQVFFDFINPRLKSWVKNNVKMFLTVFPEGMPLANGL